MLGGCVAVATVAACDNVYIKLGGAQQRMGPWTPPFHIRCVPNEVTLTTQFERVVV
jgi:hypothetical protein|eukprot:COSAG03_NODE_92_length_13295_cov_193.147014_6_plen_56_part_00